MLRSRDRNIKTLQKDYNLTRNIVDRDIDNIFQVQTHKKAYRITSYNVCYTKLLRHLLTLSVLEKSSFLLVLSSLTPSSLLCRRSIGFRPAMN